MSFFDQEHLRVLLLNTKNQVLGTHEIYIGNVNSSVVRVSEVLRPAIRDNCPSRTVSLPHHYSTISGLNAVGKDYCYAGDRLSKSW